MPPKRAKKAPPAPVRRSARIQSREPSIETETGELLTSHPPTRLQLTSATAPAPSDAHAIDLIVSPPRRSPSPPLTAVVKKTSNTYTPLRRELTLAKLRQEAVERERRVKEEEAAAKKRTLATPPRQLPSPPSPQQIPPPATAPQSRVAAQEQASGGIRSIISSLTGYFTGPFTRKRAASEGEDETPVPSNKRSRMQEPDEISNEDAVFASPTTASSNRRTRFEEPIEQPHSYSELRNATSNKRTHKRKRSEESVEAPDAHLSVTPASSSIAITPDIAARAQDSTSADDGPSTVVILDEEEEPTPIPQQRPTHTPNPTRGFASPSPRAGPSTRRFNEPTSLSTITEYTEPSYPSNLSQIEEASPTPSKPPRVQPAPSNLDLLQSTPSQPRSALHQRQSTTRRTPMGTPLMRRAAQLRAAREAEQSGTPSTSAVPFSISKRAPPPKPRESNADIRQAKLERMRELQRELEELQKDADVQEMQSHRRKRVKIDNLVSIPHNLPGDPSGMFRVPEGDSDDEMEVYDDVEERSNVFEDSERMANEVAPPKPQAPAPAVKESFAATPQPAKTHTPALPAAKTFTPAPQGVKSTPAVAPQSVKEAAKPQPPTLSEVPPPKLFAPTPSVKDIVTMEFDFPNVGPIPAGYYVSEAYKEEACALFEAGLTKWLAAQ